jgi:hypothetical protein
MRGKRIFALRALSRMSGQPMGDATLKQTLRLAYPAELRADADAEAIIRAVESEGWIVGYTDSLVGLQWLITSKGELKLRAVGSP